jgi:hypothetical protein
MAAAAPLADVPRTQPGCLRHVARKLITKEDPIHLHKTLGILSLASFVFRYAYVYPTRGSLGFDGSWFDMLSWTTMILHTALSTSSLIFHVLAHRIFKRPMIIWAEYRLHAIIFSVRCLSVFLFGRYMIFTHGKRSNLSSFCLFCLVMLHHLVVDEVTRRIGTKGGTTVRVDGSSTWYIKLPLKGYAFYQFLALGSHLVPSEHSADLGFNTLIAIQSSAFLMTLYRKGLITNYTHGIWYTGCLLTSAFHILRAFPGYWFPAKILIVFMLRITLRDRVSKYVLWAGFCLLSSPWGESFVAIAQPTAINYLEHSQHLWQNVQLGHENVNLASSLGLVALLGMGYVANNKKEGQAGTPPPLASKKSN